MKLLIVLSIFLFSSTFALGQPKAKLPVSKKSKHSSTKAVRKPIRTVSLGVLNGRALDLVTPSYPPGAAALNVYGQIQVRVIIETNGNVISAEVIKGHPLLRSAARKAALESRFVPLTLESGEAVRINGTISYNFRKYGWNWLEIGYSLGGRSDYYSLEALRDQLPSGFSEQTPVTSDLSESFVARIKGKLLNDDRASWFFNVGYLIAKMKSHCCRIDDGTASISNELSSLLLSAPQNVSPILLDKMKRIILLAEKPDSDENVIEFSSSLSKYFWGHRGSVSNHWEINQGQY